MAAGHAAAATPDVVNPMKVAGADHPSALKLARVASAEQPEAPAAAVVFHRGEFTFNRRFFETKLGGFFGVVRREQERNQVVVIKAARGEFVAQRITRIAANELHVQVQRGHASEEVMVPFQEIQEVQIKQRTA